MIEFIEKALLKLLKLWWKITVPIRLTMKGVEIGKDVVFYGAPIVSLSQGSKIYIGDRVVICSDSRFTDLGVNHPVVLRTLSPGAELFIGDDTGISGASICVADRVEIGRSCLVGANVIIADTDFHSIKSSDRRYNNDPGNIYTKNIKISNNVFLGVNSTVLKGVEIGENSVVGANSTVSSSIPNDEVWAGCPAKLLKKIND